MTPDERQERILLTLHAVLVELRTLRALLERMAPRDGWEIAHDRDERTRDGR